MRRVLIAAALVGVVGAACAGDAGQPQATADGGEGGTVTIYSGRSEDLVGPVIELFEDATGLTARVRYGDTAELAAAIQEEGAGSPADAFFSQDAGALGALAEAALLAELPSGVLEKVPAKFRSPQGLWVGTSGRARVAVYNTANVEAGDLPDSVLGLTDAKWKGRVGWAPTNGSFQSFVTALRKTKGEDAAKTWLRDMKANDTKVFDGNSPIVQAVASGEIDVGLVNHYYLLELGEQDASIKRKAANHFFAAGDPGSLINVAGAGILKSARNADGARRFVEFLLDRTARQYFDEEVFEYPLTEGATAHAELRPLSEIEQPDLDLSDLADLEGTLALLRETGVIP